jgi:hypothetical protein
MKKVVLMAAVVAAFAFTSCGGGPSVCDCMKDEKAEGCDELQKEWEKKVEDAKTDEEKEKVMKEMMEEASKCEEAEGEKK